MIAMRRFAAVLASAFLPAAVVAQSPANNAAGTPLKVMFGVEAMSWWFQGSPTPVPIVSNGVLGTPGSSVLLGGGSVDTNPNPGLRVSLVYVPRQNIGIDGNYLYVRERSATNGVSSSGQPASADIFVPFYNVNTASEDINNLSHAGAYAGNASTELINSMQGAEINVNWPLALGEPWDVRLFGGVRWLRLKEKYVVNTSSPNIKFPFDVWTTNDTFDAQNNFWGGQLGARGAWRRDNWLVSGAAQVALGGMVQKVNVNGELVTNDFNNYGDTQTFAGGYFALPTNSGTRSRTVFAAVPELKLNIGYFFTPTATISIGYDLVYMSSVVRPGEQIDRSINPTQSVAYTSDPLARLQGSAQPAFNYNTSSFWAQAVSIGVHIRY